MTVPFAVLIVDDNRDVADSTAVLIRNSGFTARVAYDGRQAVSSAIANRPDCVILDIGMPAMDGYAVARELRANPVTRDTKLIAYTAYSTGRHAELIKQSGFDYHLVKGITDYDQLEELLNMLKDIKKLAEQTKKTAEQSAELVGETKELLKDAKTEFRHARGGIADVKGDLKDVKGDLKDVKGEIKEVKTELREVKEELKEVKEDLRYTKQSTNDD